MEHVGDAPDATVAAIVVTHDRPDVLALTLDSLLAQTHAITKIFVVDSGSTTDGTARVLADRHDITLIAIDDNVGYGAALSEGIEHAHAQLLPDYYWLLDDDSPVAPESLARALALAASTERLGIMGNRGGRMRAGLPRWFGSSSTEPRDAHFCTVDGALLTREAVRVSGTPRRDFFMMHEDIEYTTRIHSCGLRVLVADRVASQPMHLGAATGATTFWRDYYQSRNHLRFALDRRSLSGVAGWAVREGTMIAFAARRGRGRPKARAILRGARDAIANNMGRTVEPGSI